MSPNMSSKDSPDLDPEILSVTGLAKSAETGLGINNFLQPPISTSSPSSDPNNCFNRMINKSVAVVKWVIRDFQLRHLVRNMYNSQSLVFSLIDCRNSISLYSQLFYTYWFYTEFLTRYIWPNNETKLLFYLYRSPLNLIIVNVIIWLTRSNWLRLTKSQMTLSSF